MILGISGSLGSGKDTVAEYLIKKIFQHISLSNLLREEAKKRGIKSDRDSLREFSNVISKEQGSDFLAKLAINKKNKRNLVISSVRKPGEVDYLKILPDFKLIFVDAPIEIRFARIKNRGRSDEKEIGLQEFKEKEAIEKSGQSSQQLDYCKTKADYLIDNSRDLNHLYFQIEKFWRRINA